MIIFHSLAASHKILIYLFSKIATKGNSVSCSNTPQVRPRNGKGISLHNSSRFGREQKQETHKNSNVILPSPTRSEEHQYDIPFSHLSQLNSALQNQDRDVLNPEYDEMIVNDSNNHVNRGSTAVLLPSSSNKTNKTSWNKFATGDNDRLRRENNSPGPNVNTSGMLWGGNTLLQPRLVSGETGGTQLLVKHDNGVGTRWSGSERSIDTSVYSGIILMIFQ